MSLPNEQLRTHILSIRDKISSVMAQLGDANQGSKDNPTEDLDPLGEAIRFLQDLDEGCLAGETLPTEAAVRLALELTITDRIVEFHLGCLLARQIGKLALGGYPPGGDLRCPCWSGRSFVDCCGSGSMPTE